jgi:quinohemoprotein ethanol dehydrogenase
MGLLAKSGALRALWLGGAAIGMVTSGLIGSIAQGAGPQGLAVNAASIAAAAQKGDNWLSHGRSYDEQRFSPLTQINEANVGQLGLAWYADMDTARGQEATPLVIDGVIYTTTAWSKAKAYDALTGKLLWQYDPKVPGETGVKACCDVVNRGMGAWGNKLFLGTLDGRLIALDRKTGKVLWSKVTVDQSKPYTITGAPRVINGLVIIGNGGAEMGVRGFVAAYDANTGKQVWKFYTVPDAPGKNAPEYLRRAEATWKGEYWKLGGGGTVWDSMAYDEKLDLLYIGVGNGSPWNQAYRSPGGGDNLYLSSIVAVRPKTGEYVWHFQETPGETWDFTATQHIVLADLMIKGQKRKVLMHAPKNGFFYVVDRETGQFISGKNFVPVNWASGLDPVTGRPIEIPEARYDKTGKFAFVTPGAGGAHSWHPMAWDPKQNLMFIPIQIAGFPYMPEEGWKAAKYGFNNGLNQGAAALPADEAARAAAKAATKGALIAWDPLTQSERWRVDYPGPSNGGLLATAGDLLFQGTAKGDFLAYSTKDGKKLWSFGAQTGVIAAPVTFTVKGQQYVAVMAGWGGIWPLATGALAWNSGQMQNISRLLVFKLGGKAKLPAAPDMTLAPLDPPPATASAEVVAKGAFTFGRFCGTCHGDGAIGGGVLPDLRRSAALHSAETWSAIVHDGALKDRGMIAWGTQLSREDIEAVRAYVIKRAHEDKALGNK